MSKNKHTKRALLASVLSIVLCLTMLVGSTFAWFTDSVTSANNKIVAGNLDIGLEYSSDMASWADVKDSDTVFDKDALWEPGYTQVVYFRITNNGELAMKYQFGTNLLVNYIGKTVAGADIDLTKFIKFGIAENITEAYADRDAARNAVASTAIDFSTYFVNGKLLEAGASTVVAMVVFMPTETDNSANHSGKPEDVPYIEFGVSVVATQQAYESDSMGDDYDANAQYPSVDYGDIVAPTPASEFEEKLNAAQNGDTIIVNGTVALAKRLTINKNITIKAGPAGATFTGTPLTVGSNANVTLYGLTFENPTNSDNKASAVYASSYAGKLVVDNCTFKNCKWDGIQVTPVDGADITITNCTFTNDAGWEGHRFLHIEATDRSGACTAKVTVTNNSFGSCDTVTESLIDIDFIDYVNNMIAGGNTFADDSITPGYIFVCKTYPGDVMSDADAYCILFDRHLIQSVILF